MTPGRLLISTSHQHTPCNRSPCSKHKRTRLFLLCVHHIATICCHGCVDARVYLIQTGVATYVSVFVCYYMHVIVLVFLDSLQVSAMCAHARHGDPAVQVPVPASYLLALCDTAWRSILDSITTLLRFLLWSPGFLFFSRAASRPAGVAH